MGWIQTTSGGGYDFEAKTLIGRYDFERDVAHSLAGLNRYVNHTVHPWPVALHSTAVARFIKAVGGEPYEVLAGLLHDMHEGVIGDIATPVARYVAYDAIEKLKSEVQSAQEFRLGIPEKAWMENNLDIIKRADVAALHVERQLFMVPGQLDWGYRPPTAEDAQIMYDQVVMLLGEEHTDGGRNVMCHHYAKQMQLLGANAE